ncbi:class I SAM-dependent RNA methyltransferase [Aurantimonas marianensis]|uniref:Class I SAM-dependent RNA methyltransferase n=1 Tax=Aurantimonas marianensis TaxID=2920428 RepID=A0A9X2H8F1_9HYPH|nr:class I SAM-dependent RNA methyltransferase [Aurantimonas marianensis]MCP3056206.1 class I SAM-dependent RNA methyltransferase [Aurantimonas marianensis]
MSERVTIDRLGARGDGIAETGAGAIFVPFTLPGEVVAIATGGPRAEAAMIIDASPHRQTPPCPHFGTCGGCDLQHADDGFYHAFKRDLVVEALARAGVEADVGDIVPCPPASRRRVAFSAVRAGNQVLLGFNAAHSNRIVPISVCPIALPAIERALPALQKLAAILVDRKRPLKLTVTATLTGLDVAIADAAKLSEPMRRQAVSLALGEGFAQLSVSGETLVVTQPPTMDFGGMTVELPAGAFVQAVASAESAMASLVLSHMAGAKRVADLCAGCGTFALRLAPHATVHAVEAEAAPLAAITAAWRARPGLKPLTTERRDLFRRPIPAKELKPYEGVVFDPPRAGAEGVARELAASTVGRIAAVSCNPVTLARDLKILTDGGYRVNSVTPIDQFLWSRHVEVVALLER